MVSIGGWQAHHPSATKAVDLIMAANWEGQ